MFWCVCWFTLSTIKWLILTEYSAMLCQYGHLLAKCYLRNWDGKMSLHSHVFSTKKNDFKLLSVLKNLHKVLRIYFMIFLKKDSFITMVLRNISMLVWEGKKKKKTWGSPKLCRKWRKRFNDWVKGLLERDTFYTGISIYFAAKL